MIRIRTDDLLFIISKNNLQKHFPNSLLLHTSNNDINENNLIIGTESDSKSFDITTIYLDIDPYIMKQIIRLLRGLNIEDSFKETQQLISTLKKLKMENLISLSKIDSDNNQQFSSIYDLTTVNNPISKTNHIDKDFTIPDKPIENNLIEIKEMLGGFYNSLNKNTSSISLNSISLTNSENFSDGDNYQNNQNNQNYQNNQNNQNNISKIFGIPKIKEFALSTELTDFDKFSDFTSNVIETINSINLTQNKKQKKSKSKSIQLCSETN